jgi:hypothetical protein
MTTLENRPNTALLVVDVQNGVEGAHESDAVVANIGSLVEKARQEQTRRWSGTPTRRRIRRPGGPATGPGDRAHEPLLDLRGGAGADGRDGRDQGGRLRRRLLS